MLFRERFLSQPKGKIGDVEKFELRVSARNCFYTNGQPELKGS